MSGPGFNGTQEIIDIPADTGGYLNLVATGPVRYVEVVESTLTAAGAPNTPQGFNYLLRNDGTTPGFTQVFNNPPSTVLELGDTQAKYTRHGILLGNGPDTPGAGQPPIPATILFKAQSATATGTSLLIRQYY